MKVMITIPWFVPAFRAGGPIRSVAHLTENFKDNIEYYIFTGSKDLGGEPISIDKKDSWLEYNSNTKVWYAEEEISKHADEQCDQLKPDALFIIGIFSWHFNIVPLLFCKAGKKILSVRGMLHPGALSQKSFKKKAFLQLLKIWGVVNKVIFHATDDTEAVHIREVFGPLSKIRVAGNFPAAVADVPALYKEPGRLNLVTVAIISPMKSYLEVIQSLKQCTGEIVYSIYGAIKDPAYWEQCKAVISSLPKNITVNYHGETEPAAIESIFMQQHLFIMPSKSENFGHAIAEALACGRPVITSFATPWNGLQEMNAGMNTDPVPDQLSATISFFAAMNNDEYRFYSAGAKKYYSFKTDRDLLRRQYEQLFQ